MIEPNELKLVSLGSVLYGDLLFKISELNGNIMVVALNHLTNWTTVKFFSNESNAKIFVDYLIGTNNDIS